jgi:DNA-directed RNA polymerase subunit RPC12/RpoP
MINLYPTTCNICGGKVIYTNNANIYGKSYGSGKCYLCTKCGAYVGTHVSRPRKAFGILADKHLRDLKIKCHDCFDKLWRNKKNAGHKRSKYYKQLAYLLDIPLEECHFGYFDEKMLNKAFEVINKIKKEC